VAKLLAYADCSIQVLANGDPRLCDCNRIIAADAIPLAADQPDKQKDILLKADWKYVGVVSYQFSNTVMLIEETHTGKFVSYIPKPTSQSIFHPPQS
jgi:hypothetical protein